MPSDLKSSVPVPHHCPVILSSGGGGSMRHEIQLVIKCPGQLRGDDAVWICPGLSHYAL